LKEFKGKRIELLVLEVWSEQSTNVTNRRAKSKKKGATKSRGFFGAKTGVQRIKEQRRRKQVGKGVERVWGKEKEKQMGKKNLSTKQPKKIRKYGGAPSLEEDEGRLQQA